MSIDGELAGKVAVVTGASRGIGKAIAIGYGTAGASVCCVARTESDLAMTVAEIKQAGGDAAAVRADVTEYDSVVQAFDASAGVFGGIDIVVINAGGNFDDSRDAESSSLEQWIQTIQVNLIGAYYTARAAIPHLKRRGGGKIIAIGSGLGRRGRPGGSAYASAKAGLSMLTRVLALELWPNNISVNELVPGPVLTSRVAGSYAQDPQSVFQDDSEWVKTPEDVVPLALYMATQPEKGPTGQTFSLMRRDM